MGWNPFESEEVTRVATSVSRVVRNNAIPDSVKTGLIKSVLADGSVPDYTMEELVGSIGIRAERLYRYAGKSYTYGLPSGEKYSSTQGRLEVEAAIEEAEGQQVYMEYSHYGSANALHIGWTKLLADHGYVPSTNRLTVLSASKGVPVYLKDMVVVVPNSLMGKIDPRQIAQWGSAACGGYTPERPFSLGDLVPLATPTPIHYSASASAVFLQVTAVWQVGRLIHSQNFSINLSGYDLKANYFHAKYVVGGVTKYWMYRNDSGDIPALDNVYVDAPAVSGEYFPFVYFRYNKVSAASNPSSAGYKTSKRMLKILGMDFDLITTAVHENPGIGDVEQAMLTFAVPPVSSNPIECRYLFDYFDQQFAALGGTASPAVASVADRLSKSTAANAVVIKDKRFKMVLGNGGIYKQRVAGTIGPVGTYKSVFASTTISEASIDYETGESVIQSVPVKVHKYRHQITRGLYEEIVVKDLQMTYYVYGGYTTVGDDTDAILLIPIDRSISRTYSIAEREILYTRSLHFVFNSRTVTEVKWYQQSWFSTLLIVVAIVLTVIDLGADGGSWITAATGLTGYQAVIAAVVINLAIGALLPKVFSLFVKVFGRDVAILLAIAAIMYGGYQLMANGSQAIPTASTMLQLSTGLQQAVLQDQFSELLSDAANLQQYFSQQEDLIEKANKLLETTSFLSPFVIFGEKPEEFYNRTIHTGNIGIMSIDAISSYVDIALTLPKLNDTLGEEINGIL